MNGEMTTAARVKQTHCLLVDEATWAFDVPGLRLALMSRGRRWLGHCPERDQLAGLLGGGALAELLTSGAPIRVDSAAGAYLFEQRSFEGM